MRQLAATIWFFYKIFAFLTVVIYLICSYTLSSHWALGFVMIGLPVIWIGHIGFLTAWIFAKSARAVLPLAVLLFAWPLYSRTYKFGSTTSTETPPSSFKLLNYNVYGFGRQANGDLVEHDEFIRTSVEWIANTDASILCFQEYFSPEKKGRINLENFFYQKGFKHYIYLDKGKASKSSIHQGGLVIFSKFPIVNRKDVFFEGQNGLLSADLAIGNDTIRIINAHLYSMTLKLSLLAHQKQYSGVKRETRGTLRQMQRGFINRNTEVHLLESWIAESPYPVVVCGDFNETPYSYVYGRLRKRLANAFEVKGSGFGFTYNSLPKFIRIDNQFFDDSNLALHDFTTHRNVRFSDHYPLTGTYSFKQ
jgi:endonuclease/exonuclease/phosphatase family metal-dependent hydrolase